MVSRLISYNAERGMVLWFVFLIITSATGCSDLFLDTVQCCTVYCTRDGAQLHVFPLSD